MIRAVVVVDADRSFGCDGLRVEGRGADSAHGFGTSSPRCCPVFRGILAVEL